MIVRRGDIWLADLGQRDGSEQRGVRPVLIISNNVGNQFSPIVIVASITTAKREEFPTHVKVNQEESGLPKESVIMLEQIHTVDKKKLREWAGSLREDAMKEVETKMRVSLGLVN